MTVNHVFYIPLILFAGGLIGALIMRRHLRLKIAQEERERRLLEERKQLRQQRRDAQANAERESAEP